MGVVLSITACSSLQTDFKPVSVIFVIDSSASNQKNLAQEKSFIKRFVSFLDPSDKISIIKTSETVYLIYQGKPNRPIPISKSMDKFTQLEPNEKGTAYGKAIDRALNLAKQENKNGFRPVIVVIGDLEDEYVKEGNLNWDTIAVEIKKLKAVAPETTFAFFFAHPQKLDNINQKLTDILNNNLLIAPETATNETLRTLLDQINR